MTGNSLEVYVVPSKQAASETALRELRRVVDAQPHEPTGSSLRSGQGTESQGSGWPEPRLISFATGATFTGVFERIAREVAEGQLSLDGLLGTHLDEYVGFPPNAPGGMVHELLAACPPLGEMLRRGTFFPVPHGDTDELPLVEALDAHRERLGRAGGLALQFLGIGRNGHLAFNEPGTSLDATFHVTGLAKTTLADAAGRFRGHQQPSSAATAGLADICAAQRVVLMAFGAAKAHAVSQMLEGPITTACPASVLQSHSNTLIVLDEAAAERLQKREHFFTAP